MKYGDAVKPLKQPLDKNLLIRTLKMVNVGDVTNDLEPYGLSPMHGLPVSQDQVSRHMGFEGGSGISVANASEYYGKPGTLLRRKLRIVKCPWPNGQLDLRLRITITFGHTVGANGSNAEPKVYVRKWFRDSNMPFEETFESNTAPATDFMRGLGYSDATASVKVTLTPHGVGPGEPLVWNDENGLSESYVHCLLSDPQFSQGVTYIAMYPPYERNLFLPCPQWVRHRMAFSEGFVGVYYATFLGLVEGVGATVEAIGWDTGFHDLEGWHAGTPEDPYQEPNPNSYEYPNYPISDPFNPVGEGVG